MSPFGILRTLSASGWTSLIKYLTYYSCETMVRDESWYSRLLNRDTLSRILQPCSTWDWLRCRGGLSISIQFSRTIPSVSKKVSTKLFNCSDWCISRDRIYMLSDFVTFCQGFFRVGSFLSFLGLVFSTTEVFVSTLLDFRPDLDRWFSCCSMRGFGFSCFYSS